MWELLYKQTTAVCSTEILEENSVNVSYIETKHNIHRRSSSNRNHTCRSRILLLPSAKRPTMTTQPMPTYKDTIVIGTTDTVQTTLDPADAYDYFAQSVIMTNMAGGLVEYRPGTTIVPALATDWTVSSDGLTWTFNLRQGVKFADGTPFNANVVKYSMDREYAIDEPSGPFAGVGLDTMINKTVVTGPYQVQFVLNEPFSAFLAMVAFQAMWPVNPNVAPMNAIVNYTGNVNTEVQHKHRSLHADQLGKNSRQGC